MPFTRKQWLLTTVSSTCIAVSAPMAIAQEASFEIDDTYLGEVVVGQSKRDINTDSAVAETVISLEEMEDRQASTIGELIDTVPGVSLVNGGTPQGSGINIRGYGANGTYGTDQKVAIIVDGATTGQEEVYRIGTQLFTDPALYRQVEVIRGTVGSFEYGSGIVGGVVLMETKDASDLTGGEPGFRFNQTLQGASNGNGLMSSSTLAYQYDDRFEAVLNYTYQTQDEQTDGNGDTIENSDFALPSYLVKGRYNFGQDLNQSFTLSYTNSAVAERDVPYDAIGGATYFGNVDRDTETDMISARYQYTPLGNDLVDVDVNLSYSSQDINQTCVATMFDDCVSANPMRLTDLDYTYETTKLVAKNTALFETGAVSHELRAGVEFMHRDRTPGQYSTSNPGGTDDRVGVFFVDQIDFGNGLTLIPAARWEDQNLSSDNSGEDYSKDALMGGISARYEFDSGFAVFASAAYTEGLPPIDDVDSIYGFAEQPEKSRTIEGGFSYNSFDLFDDGDNLRLKANIYATHLWDNTSYQLGYPAPELVDVIDTDGVELEASYARLDGFYVDVNGTVANGTYTTVSGASSDWQYTPADTARVTFGKRFGDKIDASWEVVGVRGDEFSTGYGVHNIRMTYRPDAGGAWEDVVVRGGLENAFDRTYKQPLATKNATGRNFKLTVAKLF